MPQPTPGLKIASLRGVPVYVGRTWPIIAVIIVAIFGPQVASLHPEWGFGAYVVGIGYASSTTRRDGRRRSSSRTRRCSR